MSGELRLRNPDGHRAFQQAADRRGPATRAPREAESVSAVLSYFEIFGRRFAAIGDDLELELDLLAFIERTQTRALDRRNMHEDIFFLAGGRLDEAVAFGGLNHLTVPFCLVSLLVGPDAA